MLVHFGQNYYLPRKHSNSGQYVECDYSFDNDSVILPEGFCIEQYNKLYVGLGPNNFLSGKPSSGLRQKLTLNGYR